MTREEFGLPLFDTIKTCGAMMANLDQYNAAAMKGDTAQMSRRLAERRQLKAQLTAQMDNLNTEAAAAIVNRYPWVLALDETGVEG